MSSSEHPLAGRVALVTGASRGVGKGIALALGAAGATVYITGRTDRTHAATVSLAGTIDETAAEVSALGGVGIAVRCDHRDDAQTEAVFARIQAEQGRLDVLANSAWAGYEGLHDGYDLPPRPFWERRLDYWDDNLSGVRAAYVASALAARIMVPQGRGLIACVSNRVEPSGNVAYGVAKRATDLLAAEAAVDLRPHGVSVVSLYPGLVKTEGVMKHAAYFDLTNAETPQFTGRAVVALATDPDALRWSGQALAVADLAEALGFTDVDGRIPRMG